MKLRHVTKTVGISAAVASVGALSSLAFIGTAGAAVVPASGSTVAVASPQSTFTPGKPFSSGQIITVNVPANTAFTSTSQNIEIAECADPNGVVPTLTSQCDTNTLDADTIYPNADGSLSYSNFIVYALPDKASLGEGPTTTPVCGNTPATECTLYVGPDVADFTAAHYFTQPFYVVPSAGDSGASPGDGTPEVPLAVGLPLAAAGIMGGLVYRRRRRTARPAA